MLGSWYDISMTRKAFRAVPITADASGGDRMLEYELLKRTAFEHHGVFIERTHPTRKLDAIQQMDSNVLVALQGIVKERFLDVADRHGPTPQSQTAGAPPQHPFRDGDKIGAGRRGCPIYNSTFHNRL